MGVRRLQEDGSSSRDGLAAVDTLTVVAAGVMLEKEPSALNRWVCARAELPDVVPERARRLQFLAEERQARVFALASEEELPQVVPPAMVGLWPPLPPEA
jgi:hypothetical protein